VSGFILFYILVIVVFFIMRQIRRSNAIEALKNSGGYKVALEIKDELSKQGYEFSELSTYFVHGDAVGNFYVYNKDGGQIAFSLSGFALYSAEYGLRQENITSGGRYYAVENYNIGLLVQSSKESQTIPPFIEQAAEVIKNSEYVFEHPKWLYENPEARSYLNVMFQ
jgi:hypothetical protein